MKRSTDNTTAYNDAVKQAYFKLLKHTKQQLSTIERDELRVDIGFPFVAEWIVVCCHN